MPRPIQRRNLRGACQVGRAALCHLWARELPVARLAVLNTAWPAAAVAAEGSRALPMEAAAAPEGNASVSAAFRVRALREALPMPTGNGATTQPLTLGAAAEGVVARR